ncbi:MAG: folate-binding protein YgfZ [Lysobacterales bacterium]
MDLVSLVSEYRVLAVAGSDATAFLQAQFTCDLNALDEESACAGALLNPKGKVLAMGYLLPQPGHWLLLVHPSVAEQTATHLSRYILRAKVEIDSSPWSAVGVMPETDSAEDHANDNFSRLPARSANLFLLPDGRQVGVSKTEADTRHLAVWRQWDLRAGMVSVDNAIQERFIPQMLGLDVLGAVSFSKGCYPGQEIVARARHLGRVKRGLALLESRGELSAGMELSDQGDVRCGEVINVLQTGAGWLALAVVNRDVSALTSIDRVSHFH